jgi:hypothetical protein
MRPEAEENTSRALTGELMRPRMRPSTQEEREAGERGDRASQREAKKFAKGGKVNGFPDLNKDGKVTKADILKGRGAEGFAAGGMVRGCSDMQTSGKGFRGDF